MFGELISNQSCHHQSPPMCGRWQQHPQQGVHVV
jgi:hypothetical protein